MLLLMATQEVCVVQSACSECPESMSVVTIVLIFGNTRRQSFEADQASIKEVSLWWVELLETTTVTART